MTKLKLAVIAMVGAAFILIIYGCLIIDSSGEVRKSIGVILVVFGYDLILKADKIREIIKKKSHND